MMMKIVICNQAISYQAEILQASLENLVSQEMKAHPLF